ncbi:MAG: hypothetical protein OXC44_03160 [Proteobacteria bacterium]|nr:hypothetical protein [Pseudomonadota bacterium]
MMKYACSILLSCSLCVMMFDVAEASSEQVYLLEDAEAETDSTASPEQHYRLMTCSSLNSQGALNSYSDEGREALNELSCAPLLASMDNQVSESEVSEVAVVLPSLAAASAVGVGGLSMKNVFAVSQMSVPSVGGVSGSWARFIQPQLLKTQKNPFWLTIAGLGVVAGYVYKRLNKGDAGVWLHASQDHKELTTSSQALPANDSDAHLSQNNRPPTMVPMLAEVDEELFSNGHQQSLNGQSNGYQNTNMDLMRFYVGEPLPAHLYFSTFSRVLKDYASRLADISSTLKKVDNKEFVDHIESQLWYEVFFQRELNSRDQLLEFSEHSFKSLGFRLVDLKRNITERILPYIAESHNSDLLAHLYVQFDELALISLRLGHVLVSLENRFWGMIITDQKTKKMFSSFLYSTFVLQDLKKESLVNLSNIEDYYMLDLNKLSYLLSRFGDNVENLAVQFKSLMIQDGNQEGISGSFSSLKGIVMVPQQVLPNELAIFSDPRGRLIIAVSLALEMLRPMQEILQNSFAHGDGQLNDPDILLWDGSTVSRDVLHGMAYDGLVRALQKHSSYDMAEVLESHVYRNDLGMIYQSPFSASLLRSTAALERIAQELDLNIDQRAEIVGMWTRSVSAHSRAQFMNMKMESADDQDSLNQLVWNLATDLLNVSAVLDQHHAQFKLESAISLGLNKHGTSAYERWRASNYVLSSSPCESCDTPSFKEGFEGRYVQHALLFNNLSQKNYERKQHQAESDNLAQKTMLLKNLEEWKEHYTFKINQDIGSVYIEEDYQLLLKNYAALEFLEDRVFAILASF